MTETPDFLKQYAEEEKQVPEDKLEKLSHYAQEMTDNLKQREEKKAEIEKLKKDYEKVAKEYVPAVMDELNFTGVPVNIADGKSLVVEDMIAATLTKDQTKREKIFDNLRERGYGDVIKDTVTLYLGKGNDEIAVEIMNYVNEKYPNVGLERKEDIHPQTYKSTVKRMLEAGEDIDKKLYQVFQWSEAIIKKVKG